MLEYLSIIIIFTLIGILAVIVLILIRGFPDTFASYLGEIQCSSHFHKSKKKKQEIKDPLTILKIRYARGDLKKEEYEEMKKVLIN